MAESVHKLRSDWIAVSRERLTGQDCSPSSLHHIEQVKEYQEGLPTEEAASTLTALNLDSKTLNTIDSSPTVLQCIRCAQNGYKCDADGRRCQACTGRGNRC